MKNKKQSRKKVASKRKAPARKVENRNVLPNVVTKALTKNSTLQGIFLVRQGLRARTEQYITLANSKEDALWFCRNFLTPKYCRENESHSLHFYNPKVDKTLKVNSDRNHLLIKGEDFDRRELGRTNQDPLWYLNIATLTVVKKTTK